MFISLLLLFRKATNARWIRVNILVFDRPKAKRAVITFGYFNLLVFCQWPLLHKEDMGGFSI